MIGKRKRSVRRREWNFPSFNPDMMDELTFKACRVTIFKNGSVQIALNFAEQFRNEHLPPDWIRRRILLSLGGCERIPNGARADESTITLSFKKDAGMVRRLRNRQAVQVRSCRTEACLTVTSYDLNDLA